MMVEEKAYIYYVLLLMSYFCFSVKVQLLRMIGVFFVNLNLHQIKSNRQYNGTLGKALVSQMTQKQYNSL